MIHQHKISVIVVVYQSEMVLRRCIDSIIMQTFEDFELLLVDDGSTDMSSKICDEYSEKDERICVFHRCHEGVSSCRQYGIEKATGEYSIFCDSDDWMDENMLDVLYCKAKSEDADLVMCDVTMEFSDYSILRRQRPSDLTANGILKNLGCSIQPTVWNKLIRLNCYKRYNLFFPKEMSYAEDLYILMNLFSHPIKVAYTGEASYHYDRYSNKKSITRGGADFVPGYIKSLDYLEKRTDENLQQIIIYQKIGVLQILLNISVDELHKYDNLYKEINGYMIKNGFLHPFRNRHLFRLSLYRLNLNRLAGVVSGVISFGAKIKRLVGRMLKL